MVAIGGAAGSVGKTAHLGITRRHHHVQEAIDIGGVAGDRIVEATRHRAERGLMEHVVDTLAGATAVFQMPNVALNEAEARPLLGTDQALHLVKVALVAGGEVVQPDHALVELEQGFEQVGADEAGYAGNEPGLRVLGEVDAELVVAGHGAGCGGLGGSRLAPLLQGWVQLGGSVVGAAPTARFLGRLGWAVAPLKARGWRRSYRGGCGG